MKLFALLFLAVLALASGKPKQLIPLMPKVTPNSSNNPSRVLHPSKPIARAKIPGTTKVAGCGVAAVLDNSKIKNGVEATPHEFPWQVALTTDYYYFCGGSLISNLWILTAAHCIDGFSTIKVVMGAHNKDIVETSQVTMTATTYLVHPEFEFVTYHNDVGLVQLPEPVTYTAEILPICLPSYSDSGIGAGVMLTASGWGYTTSEELSPVLMKVTNPTISNIDCSPFYGYWIFDGTICTNTSSANQGTCKQSRMGDSGGPLMLVYGGLTFSRGVSSFYECDSGYPIGFARTSYYLDWIETVTGIEIDH